MGWWPPFTVAHHHCKSKTIVHKTAAKGVGSLWGTKWDTWGVWPKSTQRANTPVPPSMCEPIKLDQQVQPKGHTINQSVCAPIRVWYKPMVQTRMDAIRSIKSGPNRPNRKSANRMPIKFEQPRSAERCTPNPVHGTAWC